MPAVLIRHKVKDVASWASVFDEHGINRRANGSRGGRLFRNAADPTELMILLEWDELTRARLFARSDDLRDALARAGVTDEPDVWFLEEVGQVTA
jgi:hypothetical protein